MDWNQTNLEFLTTVFRSDFDKGFGAVTPLWNKIATLVPSTSRKNIYAWLGEHPGFREFVDERVIKELEGRDYELENKDWESTIAIKKKDVEDDQHGVYSPRFQAQGEAAAMHPDELVFDALLSGDARIGYDGQFFFDTDHEVEGQSVANVATGAGNPWFLLKTNRTLKPLIYQVRQGYEMQTIDDPRSPDVFYKRRIVMGVDARSVVGYGHWRYAFMSTETLDATTLKANRTAMAQFKTDEGRPANSRPNVLLVGPSNEDKARELLNAQELNGSTNTLRGSLELVVSDWLE